MGHTVIAGAKCICPLIIQINPHIVGTIASDIRVTGVIAHYLDGHFLEMGEWNKKGLLVKKGRMPFNPTYHLLPTEVVFCNPQYPVNPEPESNVKSEFYL